VQEWDEIRRARLVKNEEAARGYNSRRAELEESAGADEDDMLPFLCECGDRDCVQTIVLSLEEFVDGHTKENRFVVRPGHVFPEVERVVAEGDGYWFVEKDPELMAS
jgi:hypothetical protein